MQRLESRSIEERQYRMHSKIEEEKTPTVREAPIKAPEKKFDDTLKERPNVYVNNIN